MNHVFDPPPDELAISLLDEHKAERELVQIPLGEVDWDATTAAQIRFESEDPDEITRFAELIQAGTRFPPVIAVPTEDGLWQIIGGITRAKAHRQANQPIWAYGLIGRLTPDQVFIIGVAHNSTHGTPLTDAERGRHAARMVIELEISRSEAARRVGVSPARVGRYLALDAGRDRAKRLKVAARWDNLPASGACLLQTATTDSDDLFVEAVVAAEGCSAAYTHCAELAQAVRKADGIQAKFDAVEAWEATHHQTTRTRSRQSNQVAAARSKALAASGVDWAEVYELCPDGDLVATGRLLADTGRQMMETGQLMLDHAGDS
jgi:predicted transcriptional regulator